MSDLIDTTEMYLRTIYELEEEGVVPLRARIAQRIGHSGPTVSQTVARMERDGLVTVRDDRHLELTDHGHGLAVRVMRKHRLAERLLVDVIGLRWSEAHDEACRWEHVMSEAVERRLVTLLGEPTVSPYGNPIPGLRELSDSGPAVDEGPDPSLRPLTDVEDGGSVVVRRIGEPLQTDMVALESLEAAGVGPGVTVTVGRRASEVVVIGPHGSAVLGATAAGHVLVGDVPD